MQGNTKDVLKIKWIEPTVNVNKIPIQYVHENAYIYI